MSRLKDAVAKAKAPKAKRKKKKRAKVEAPAEDNSGPPTRRRQRRRAPASSKPAATTSTEEPEAVKAAREQIKAMVAEITKGRPKVSVDLVLAIVNQETGNHAAANLLIEEFDLDKTFGIKRF